MGFDTVYSSKVNFSSLLIQALRDSRIILTRNSRFINRGRAVRLIEIKSGQINHQLRQVLAELNIKPDPERMFSRCLICNVELQEIDKQKLKDRVPEYVFKTQDEFYTCCSCGRIYWAGTHWGNASKTLKEISF